jgi:ATP-independent RNA helicase DbpA
MDNFTSLPLSQDLQDVVKELGYETLTPIQAASIPSLLNNKDLIGQSKTGSGKTAAFVLPILQKIELEPRTLQAMIICPTRELATQVVSETRKLGRRHKGLQVLLLAGGHPSKPQAEALAKGVHLVVGTPGRIVDHIQRGRLDCTGISTLVLDEADRMLDMGFEDEMKIILDDVPTRRQTILFSATFPSEIELLSRKYQNQPIKIKVEDDVATTPLVPQLIYETSQEDKFNILMRVLQQHQPKSALIFFNQKASVAQVGETLAEDHVSSACLHGDLEQRDRDKVVSMFRNGSLRILLATDVAARGLDIENLDLVVNFDLPHQADIYIHRIGRTGRAGRGGLAVTLATPNDRSRISEFLNSPEIHFEYPELGFKHQNTLPRDSILRDAENQTLVISGGRKDKLRPGDILGALTGEAGGLEAAAIGKIEINDHFSFVAIANAHATKALARLKAGRIKGKRFAVHPMK